MRCVITCKPRSPPREELPCAAPNPSRSITLRVHCPSNAVVFITTISRFRAYQEIGRITRCQKAQMQGSFFARNSSTLARPAVSNRSVGPSSRITLYTTAAMMGIWIRRVQGKVWQTRIVMRAERRLGFLALYVAVFHLPIVYRVSPFLPPRWRAKQLTSADNNGTSRSIASFLVCAAMFAASFAGTVARADNPPTDAIGVIEGEAISIDRPMNVEVVRGQVKTVLRSGSDVHVKAGQARIDLVDGGQIMICGPAHFSMFKAGGAITLALDSGTIHAQISSEVSLNVYTPQIQAHLISIGNGAEDVLVGLDS